jgi:hypothetical protein
MDVYMNGVFMTAGDTADYREQGTPAGTGAVSISFNYGLDAGYRIAVVIRRA